MSLDVEVGSIDPFYYMGTTAAGLGEGSTVGIN